MLWPWSWQWIGLCQFWDSSHDPNMDSHQRHNQSITRISCQFFFFLQMSLSAGDFYKTLHMAHLLTSFCCWDGDLGVRGTIDAEYFPGKFLIVSLAGEWALGFLDWTSTQTIAIHFGHTIVFGMRSIEGGSSCCQDDIDRYLCTAGPVELLSPRRNGKDCNLSGAFSKKS